MTSVYAKLSRRLTLSFLVTIGLPGFVPAAPETSGSSQPAASVVPATFEELAAGSGLAYRQPEGFEDAPVIMNSLWSYEHAVQRPAGDIEIRYAVRPIQRMEIAYDDPHSNAPDPNHIFPMMFQTLIDLLSDGRHTPSREYPPDQAQAKFNADWAAAALFDVDPRFTDRHTHALILAMHKNHLADAYSIYLFSDYAAAKPVIDATLDNLKFIP